VIEGVTMVEAFHIAPTWPLEALPPAGAAPGEAEAVCDDGGDALLGLSSPSRSGSQLG
jgi:hypothetical protein